MTNQRASCFRFDDICVDLRNLKILKANEELTLEPKALVLLMFLIENRDRLVEKRELLDAIRKDVAVTENALTREIGKLRKCLGDDPKTSRYIQTVHTRATGSSPPSRFSTARPNRRSRRHRSQPAPNRLPQKRLHSRLSATCRDGSHIGSLRRSASLRCLSPVHSCCASLLLVSVRPGRKSTGLPGWQSCRFDP